MAEPRRPAPDRRTCIRARAEWVGGRLAGLSVLARGFSWCLPCPPCDDADSIVLFSGTRWAARSRPSTMSWRAGRGSCTCSSTPTGRRAPTPLVARRGSASKTLPMEVALPTTRKLLVLPLGIVTCETCITYYIYFYYLHVWGNTVGRPGPILLRVEQTPCWLDESYARLSAACMIICPPFLVMPLFLNTSSPSSLRPSTSSMLPPSLSFFSRPTPRSSFPLRSFT